MFQSFMEPKKLRLSYNFNEETHKYFFLFESVIRFPWKQFKKKQLKIRP